MRRNSVWHQLDEIIRLKTQRVLEIGTGPRVFKQMAAHFDVNFEIFDLEPAHKPGHGGSDTVIPLPNSNFDVVYAFQMLEHLAAQLPSFTRLIWIRRNS